MSKPDLNDILEVAQSTKQDVGTVVAIAVGLMKRADEKSLEKNGDAEEKNKLLTDLPKLLEERPDLAKKPIQGLQALGLPIRPGHISRYKKQAEAILAITHKPNGNGHDSNS